jgi:DNA polymerase-1
MRERRFPESGRTYKIYGGGKNGTVLLALYADGTQVAAAAVKILDTVSRRRFASSVTGSAPPTDVEQELGVLALELVEELFATPPTDVDDTNATARGTDLLGLVGGRASQATRLARLADTLKLDLFHDAGRTPYVTLPAEDHWETLPVTSRRFRALLARRFFLECDEAPSGNALADATRVLEARALEGREEPVYLRRAEVDGALVIDIGDDSWDAIIVDEDGVRFAPQQQVRFRRPKSLRPLPRPVHGGSIQLLREFLPRIDVDGFRLLVAWLLAALRAHGPYPILALLGGQGAGKSTLLRMLRRLVDPAASEIRAFPKEPKDVVIAGQHSVMLAYDNISTIPDWLSDALCRLSTGGGYGGRELYTDGEEYVIDAMVPVALSGITEVAANGDLIDRCVPLELAAPSTRLAEEDFWPRFDAAAPQILGALLTGLSAALRGRRTVLVPAGVRMVDFARTAAAAMPSYQWTAEQFLDGYQAQHREMRTLPLDTTLLWPPLRALLLARKGADPLWQGTAEALLDELAGCVGEGVRRRKGWPGNPRALSGLLRRLAPALREVGFAIEFPRTGAARYIVITTATDGDPGGGDADANVENADTASVSEEESQRDGGATDLPTAATDAGPIASAAMVEGRPESATPSGNGRSAGDPDANPGLAAGATDAHDAPDANDARSAPAPYSRASCSVDGVPGDDADAGVCPGDETTCAQGADSASSASCASPVAHPRRASADSSAIVDTAMTQPQVSGGACHGAVASSAAADERGCTGASPANDAASAPAAPSVTALAGCAVAPPIFRVIADATDLRALLPALLAAPVLGLDTETTGLNPRHDRLRLVQVATREIVVVIDLFRVPTAALLPLFEHGQCFVTHNGVFDWQMLAAAGVPIPNGDRLFDTMLASQLLHAGVSEKGGTHSLAGVAERYLDRTLPKELQRSDWSGVLSEQQLRYAAQDATILLPLYAEVRARLCAAGLERVAEIEMGALPAVVWMEQTGMPFDAAAWRALSDAAVAEQVRLESTLNAAAGSDGPINWRSPQQLLQLLRQRGHAVPNTTSETLQRLPDAEPLKALLLRYRDAAKRVGTYGIAFVKYLDAQTGRIHAAFRQLGAASGRMSCAKPNLQNLPRLAAYRACFRPPDGRVLVKADYATVELRIAAQLTQDAALLHAFREGADLHRRTAATVLRVAEAAVTRDQRQLSKALNFGLLYGMGAPRLRQYAASDFGVHLTETEALTSRIQWFRAFPGVRAWHRGIPDGAIDTRTLAGRRRLNVESFTEKLNSPVQGTGADLLKLALGRLWEDRAACPSAVVVNAVHDEIVVECDAIDAMLTAAWLRQHMEAAGAELVPDVPIVAEAAVMADWSGTPVTDGAV